MQVVVAKGRCVPAVADPCEGGVGASGEFNTGPTILRQARRKQGGLAPIIHIVDAVRHG